MIKVITANLFKALTGLVILLSACLAIGQNTHSASTHVVFDLDWTLLNTTTSVMAMADPRGVLEFGGKLYRIPEGSIESLARLYQAGVQVSLFSGGDVARNDYAARVLKTKVNQYLIANSIPGLFEFRQVLSLPDLLVVSADPNVRFAERYKKELSRFFDITRTLIVDDIKEFVVRGQEKNMVWLGPTYNDRPRFGLEKIEDPAQKKFSAPSYEEWKRDKLKIVTAVDNILKAMRLAKLKKINLPDAYYLVDPYKAKFAMCGNLFML